MKNILILVFYLYCSCQVLAQEDRQYLSIQDAQKRADDVYQLNLSSRGMKEIPPEVREFKNLRYLYVQDNSIESIPEWIFTIETLRYINISDNKLSTLPKSFAKANREVFLDIRGNNLTENDKKVITKTLENSDVDWKSDVISNQICLSTNIWNTSISHPKISLGIRQVNCYKGFDFTVVINPFNYPDINLNKDAIIRFGRNSIKLKMAVIDDQIVLTTGLDTFYHELRTKTQFEIVIPGIKEDMTVKFSNVGFEKVKRIIEDVKQSVSTDITNGRYIFINLEMAIDNKDFVKYLSLKNPDPEEIDQLVEYFGSSLEYLMLAYTDNCQLSFSALAKIKTLKTLTIAGWKAEIPKDIGEMVSLETLVIAGVFSSIPDAIQNLQNLKNFDFESNEVSWTYSDDDSASPKNEGVSESDVEKLKKLLPNCTITSW